MRCRGRVRSPRLATVRESEPMSCGSFRALRTTRSVIFVVMQAILELKTGAAGSFAVMVRGGRCVGVRGENWITAAPSQPSFHILLHLPTLQAHLPSLWAPLYTWHSHPVLYASVLLFRNSCALLLHLRSPGSLFVSLVFTRICISSWVSRASGLSRDSSVSATAIVDRVVCHSLSPKRCVSFYERFCFE